MNNCNDRTFEKYSKKLKAIGHPIRLKLLCMIEKREESCVTNLWMCLDQPQPVVSQHLAVLKSCNIVEADIKGTKRFYTIIDPFVKTLIIDILKEAET